MVDVVSDSLEYIATDDAIAEDAVEEERDALSHHPAPLDKRTQCAGSKGIDGLSLVHHFVVNVDRVDDVVDLSFGAHVLRSDALSFYFINDLHYVLLNATYLFSHFMQCVLQLVFSLAVA